MFVHTGRPGGRPALLLACNWRVLAPFWLPISVLFFLMSLKNSIITFYLLSPYIFALWSQLWNKCLPRGIKSALTPLALFFLTSPVILVPFYMLDYLPRFMIAISSSHLLILFLQLFLTFSAQGNDTSWKATATDCSYFQQTSFLETTMIIGSCSGNRNQ